MHPPHEPLRRDLRCPELYTKGILYFTEARPGSAPTGIPEVFALALRHLDGLTILALLLTILVLLQRWSTDRERAHEPPANSSIGLLPTTRSTAKTACRVLRALSAAATSSCINAVGPPATRVVHSLASSTFLASCAAALFARSASAYRVTSAAAAAVALARSPNRPYSDSTEMLAAAAPVVRPPAVIRCFTY